MNEHIWASGHIDIRKMSMDAIDFCLKLSKSPSVHLDYGLTRF